MRKLFFLFIICQSAVVNALTIKVGLFTDAAMQSLLISPEKGDYSLVFDDQQRIKMDSNLVYVVQIDRDSIKVSTEGKSFGKFLKLDFIGDKRSSLRIKGTKPSKASKIYPNNLTVFAAKNCLNLLGDVELENYVAGEVEIEAGPRQTAEYYKVQAIICRTYALSNLRRHEAEKYNLCDNVHCQAYLGDNKLNPLIDAAALQTQNLVLVDKQAELITTAFHSNCGGQTCNSEDVWGMKKSYLRSVKDTFCLKQRNAQWTKVVAKSDWNQYMQQYCKPCAGDSAQFCCDFIQDERKVYLTLDSVRIPLKNVRTDLKLKSSFFSIQLDNDSLLFLGKGYGHGVGLCQEGAIQMAKLGMKYTDILHFYYKGVDIINLKQLHFFKE